MPTRRIFVLGLIGVALMHPVMGLARLWCMKALASEPPGSLKHGIAEALLIPVGTT